MKRTLLTMIILALAAGGAFAQKYEGDKSRKSGKSWGRDSGEQCEDGDRDGDRYERKRNRQDKSEAWKRNQRGGQDHQWGPDKETKELMKAYHTIIRDLGKQARAETDEAKKAELVEQLRVKMNEAADLMEKKQEERLIMAEQKLEKLRTKIEEAKANRETHIEEQLERVLAGKRPQRPEAFDDFPHAKGGRGDRGNRGGYVMRDGSGPGPFGGMPPPPMDEDMPGDDLPPPPEE